MTFGHRNFDVSFIFKDMTKPVARISTVPMESLDNLKTWLGELEIVWYEGAINMKWTNIFKEIQKDVNGFLEEGGWDGWFGEDSAAEEEEEIMDGDSSYSEDEESDGGDSDSDFSDLESEASEESEASVESDASEAMSWDEMDRAAQEEDKKKAEDRKRGRRDDDDDQPVKRKRK